jgi:hypothetical protein
MSTTNISDAEARSVPQDLGQRRSAQCTLVPNYKSNFLSSFFGKVSNLLGPDLQNFCSILVDVELKVIFWNSFARESDEGLVLPKGQIFFKKNT